MADDCKDIHISFISHNESSDFEVGKMKLSLLFVEEYKNVLPEEIFLHFPSGKVWKCLFNKNADCVEGLEDVMIFYGIKPFHMVIFHYIGGPNFNVEIFNESAVEICYPLESFQLSTKGQIRRNNTLFQNIRLDCTHVEVEKLRQTLHYNACVNFPGICEYQISTDDLKSEYWYQVFSLEDCRKMKLNVEMEFIRIGLYNCMWTVKIKWKNGTVFLDNSWYTFLKEANLVLGDLCIFHKTKFPATYRMAVTSKKLMDDYGVSEEYFKAIPQHVHYGWKWFKIFDEKSLESGELEVPRLFSLKFCHEIGEKIHIRMSTGHEFSAKYNSSRKSISGIRRIINKFCLFMGTTMIFEYTGDSNFLVSVYEYHGLDSLKEVTGEFIPFDELEAESAREVILLSDTSENGYSKNNTCTTAEAADEYSEINDDETEDNIMIDDNQSTNSNSTDNPAENGENADHNDLLLHNFNPMNEDHAFHVILRKFHVNQSSHGPYCSNRLIDIYKNWTATTEISFNYQGGVWNVAVLRKGTMCRFGRGWDNFTKTNHLEEGTILHFQFQPPLSFQVSR